MKVNSALVVSVLLLMGLAACTLPSGQANDQDLAATVTAQALLIEQGGASGSPTAGSPSSEPQVRVAADARCWAGPGDGFELVLTMPPGSTAPLIGKYTPGNYWIISNAAGGSCWMSGQQVEVTGDTSQLPEYPQPQPAANPTNKPKPEATSANSAIPLLVVTVAPTRYSAQEVPVAPNAPENLAWDRACAGGYASDGFTPIWIEDVTLTWQDSINETGYRVFKNQSPLPDLAQNSTQYHMQLRYNQGTGQALWINFGVEAFNAAGSSIRPALDVPKCP